VRRREFIAGLGTAAAWPVVARAQPQAKMRRIGYLVSGLPSDDPEYQTRSTAFVQALAQLGWIDGRNMRLYRFGLGDADRQRKYAAELVTLAPDILVAAGAPALVAFQMATRTLPIVFANVIDPVGSGFVASLARPGGNVTGFMSVEFTLSAKLLELLEQVTPRLMRVGVVRSQANIVGIAQFGAMQTAASSFGVELTPIIVRDTTTSSRSAATSLSSRAGLTAPLSLPEPPCNKLNAARSLLPRLNTRCRQSILSAASSLRAG
jgi:putative tryptophan/tyrosine transport system substrate-binding protein